MAQQVFDKSWPLGKNGASELIPGGAILQTRDGKDEPITLSANFQTSESGLFLPTGKDNPLETRVRELERLIGEIAATPTPNTLQARLKEIADRLGEAVASPNEHTLLARLKAVEEELEAVKDALTSGDAKVTLTGQVDSVGLRDVRSLLSPRSVRSRFMVMLPGGSGDWDQQYREIGNILYTPWDSGREYKFVYSGYTPPYAGNQVYVGLATSPDGKRWTKRGKITERALEDPYLVYHDGTYYLYAEDKEVVPSRNIRCYTSTDTVTWTDQGVVLDKGTGWEFSDVSSPTVWLENGTFYMFYEGRGGTNQGAVGLATSSDGINWTKHEGNPVVAPNNPAMFSRIDVPWANNIVPDDVIKRNGRYYMTLHGQGGSHADGFQPCVVTSSDLITWEPLLGRDSWDKPPVVGQGTLMFCDTGSLSLYYVIEGRSHSNGLYRVELYPEWESAAGRIEHVAYNVPVAPGATTLITENIYTYGAKSVRLIIKPSAAHTFELQIRERFNIPLGSDGYASRVVEMQGAGTIKVAQTDLNSDWYRIYIKNSDAQERSYIVQAQYSY